MGYMFCAGAWDWFSGLSNQAWPQLSRTLQSGSGLAHKLSYKVTEKVNVLKNPHSAVESQRRQHC